MNQEWDFVCAQICLEICFPTSFIQMISLSPRRKRCSVLSEQSYLTVTEQIKKGFSGIHTAQMRLTVHLRLCRQPWGAQYFYLKLCTYEGEMVIGSGITAPPQLQAGRSQPCWNPGEELLLERAEQNKAGPRARFSRAELILE